MPVAIQHTPSRPPAQERDQSLKIAVVFTSIQATLAALKEAGVLAIKLGARITLLVPKVVPYPLLLESTAALDDFHAKRFRVVAGQSPVETSVQVCLCRDPFEAIAGALTPASLVVLAGPRRWWPTREKAWADKLRRSGHEVVFKET